jgi:hypothetical protein
MGLRALNGSAMHLPAGLLTAPRTVQTRFGSVESS